MLASDINHMFNIVINKFFTVSSVIKTAENGGWERSEGKP